jgi:hypothetical protein
VAGVLLPRGAIFHATYGIRAFVSTDTRTIDRIAVTAPVMMTS